MFKDNSIFKNEALFTSLKTKYNNANIQFKEILENKNIKINSYWQKELVKMEKNIFIEEFFTPSNIKLLKKVFKILEKSNKFSKIVKSENYLNNSEISKP